jgi:hypothetical protein
MTADDTKTAIALLQVDYERTTKFIEGVVSTSASIRGWTITLTVALLGIAFERQSWALGLGAIFLILLFGLVDGYHSWLYAEALRHAQSAETTLSRYYASVVGDGDPGLQREFDVQVRTHRFGPFVNLRRFTFNSLKDARPRILLLTLYGSLVAIAGVATVIVAIAGRASKKNEVSCTVTGSTSPITIACTTK